ncbi:MAG: UDP-2,4-diacetamido-2,4,6-trideoxy-beta-L-altropyranose hydrolase [Desulfamplus sp.]|nr:UDP-2,4-diacetamido-2,4,6-trideoxy-beta-L-altropyranose hydrolase [Desulfamplus sp.]
MRMVFRVDASPVIGIGHVMRCLALAQEAKCSGYSALFIGRIASALVQHLEDEGMEVRAWNEDITFNEDLVCLLEAASGSKAVIIDHYGLGPDYQQAVRSAGHKLLVIDDFNHQPAYEADILLNQNITANRYRYRTNSSAKFLLGPQFALLRQEFLKFPRPEAASRERIVNLLITMGGSDPKNYTRRVLEVMEQLNFVDLRIKVICGPAFQWRKSLESYLKTSCMSVELLDPVRDMPPVYEWADAVIAAAGSTIYELAYFRLPSVCCNIAENQRDINHLIQKRKIAVSIDEAMNLETMKKSLIVFFGEKYFLSNYSENIGNLVDGFGTKRAIRFLFGSFFFRPVQVDDVNILFSWRNEPSVRSASFQTVPISFEEHMVWFSDRLIDPNCRFYIAEDSIGIVGQTRFMKTSQGDAIISVCLDSRRRGCGMGAKLISEALCQYHTDDGIRPVRAYVRHDNPVSLNAFLRARFIVSGKDVRNGFPCLILDYPI